MVGEWLRSGWGVVKEWLSVRRVVEEGLSG